MMNRRKVLTGGLAAVVGGLPLIALAKIPESSKPLIESEADAYNWVVSKYREGPTTYNQYAVTGEEYVELVDPYRNISWVADVYKSGFSPFNFMTGLSSPSSVWKMFELSFNMYEHRVTDGKDKKKFKVYFRIKPECCEGEVEDPPTYRGYCRLLLSDKPQLHGGEA